MAVRREYLLVEKSADKLAGVTVEMRAAPKDDEKVVQTVEKLAEQSVKRLAVK